ncbi:hypothetical protein [Confluentibacter sediminis]|uniref:hypothetical protein n=1 Tax=Confluentibacter sediminis TaxID=2219045 RepID=UPI000DAB48F0|nr:hypothetical protein [Confluentibacter sediminis]
MKTFKNIITFLFMLFIMASFYQCSSSKRLQKNLPFKIGEIYYQELGSNINIFITMKSNPKNILLDSVYFQGKQTKLEYKNNMFIGIFKTLIIKKQDIIMSHEPYAEYGNEVPKLPETSSIKPEDDECIVSYKEDNVIKYLKIEHVTQKERQLYP